MSQQEEISLKEAVNTSKTYLLEIKRNILLLLLFIIPFLAYQAYKIFTAEPMFEAPLSFMLNDEAGGGSAAISGLLGQIGIPIGGGDENLERILELSKSRKIAQKTLFRKNVIDGKSDFLANHIVAMLQEKGEWNKRSLFAGEQTYNIDGFKFSHDSFPAFNLVENNALKHLHDHLIGNSKLDISPLVKCSQNELSSIMYITSNTYNPEVSVAISNNQFEELSSYYVGKTIEKQKATFKLIKNKTDSIYGALESANYSLATFKDKNRGLFNKADQLTESRLMIEIQKLGAMYGEATKNLEISEFSLKNKTPFIQLIDEPVLPIRPQKPSIISSIILSLILGIFFGVVFIVTRKMIREALV